jgi:hypothetical protein
LMLLRFAEAAPASAIQSIRNRRGSDAHATP